MNNATIEIQFLNEKRKRETKEEFTTSDYFIPLRFSALFAVSLYVCMTILNNYERLLASMQFFIFQLEDWSFMCLWG
jgi:hypothetical protein